MSAAGALDLPQSLVPVPQRRISAKVRDAIRYMVEEGLNRPDAAEKAGIKDNSLYVAMQKPDVLAYRRQLLEVIRTSEAARSIARGAKLADKAESEHVRNDANKWLAGLDGLSPIQKSESVNVHAHLMPGLTIVLANHQPHEPDVRMIDGQAHQPQEPRQINRIGQSVPHPSQRNAMQIEAKSPGNQASAGEVGGGQKCANED